MKKELYICLNKFINSSINKEIDYKYNLSLTLLNFLLDSNLDSQCTIDLGDCNDISFVINEVFNFFDVRFPKRINIINY